MRKGLIAFVLVGAVAGASACGDSDEGTAGGGFTEADRQAAHEFVRIKAESPSLDSLDEGILDYVRHRNLRKARRTLRELRRSARRSKRLVNKFDDRRARSAMSEFAEGTAGVASGYATLVGFIAHPRPSVAKKLYPAIREMEASVDEANMADRRLSNLEAPG